MKREIEKGRKSFIKKSLMLSALPFVDMRSIFQKNEPKFSDPNPSKQNFPLVVSTWKHGLAANEAAFKVLSEHGTSIDAVESGVRVSEADPEVTSVGYGGWPDQEGNVTLDACIMRADGECGAVSYLQEIKHPISVARMVMEDTPHIMLSGKGALDFALSKGFKKEKLLTEKAHNRWIKWKDENKIKTDLNNHDTIGMLAIDEKGIISGACTTSGMAWKLPGRVGDSPIIGAGLFVDGEVGGATATGRGESVIKIAGTHLVVELMRQGMDPQRACEEAIERIVQKQSDFKNFQVGFLAVNLNGEIGAFSLQKGFQYAVHGSKGNELMNAPHHL